MKVINTHPKAMDIVVGDIHGEFSELCYKIKTYGIERANIIMLGDFGVGFHKYGYYVNELVKLDKLCMIRDCDVYVLRGNHDDPGYFKSDHPIHDELNRVHLMEDYTILKTQDHSILCIGGAHSVDRLYRKSFLRSYIDAPERKHAQQVVDWWKDEPVAKVDSIELQGFIEENKVDMICTHTTPSSFVMHTPSFVDEMIKNDNALYYDLRDEQEYMESILELAYSVVGKVKWCHGHMHHSEHIDGERVDRYSVGISEFVEM